MESITKNRTRMGAPLLLPFGNLDLDPGTGLENGKTLVERGQLKSKILAIGARSV
jgi:hypothetical protein